MAINSFETYETYDREKIMSLKGNELLDYVNTMLQNGYGFKQLCEAKGLRNKTIRQRLRDQCGAVYDMKLKCYVTDNNKNVSNDVPIVSSTESYPTDDTNNNEGGGGGSCEVSANQITDLTSAINNLMREIVCLNDTMTAQVTHQKRAIQQMQITPQPSASAKVQHPASVSSVSKFEAIPFTGEIKTRPVKVYPEVLERLDAFCLQYPQYSKQRIISTLLSHALDMYE